MDEQAAVADLLERRTKSGKQIRRQRPNKTDRVVDDNFLFARQTQASRRRIESGKHALLGVYFTLRQRIQQRGLARVGVTDNRDDGQLLARASFTPFLAALAVRFNLLFETIDAVANTTAISFQFGFTRTAATDTAGETRERGILSRDQSWQQIFQLRQLNLNLAFFRLRALRKDVED